MFNKYSIQAMFEDTILVIAFVFWIAGFVIAKGWAMVTCIIPFYAWYLVMETFMISQGWVN